MPSLTAIPLSLLVVSIIILTVVEAVRRPLFPLVMTILLAVPVFLRHDGPWWLGPLGLFASAGGWIILLFIVLASHVIADALHTFIRFARNRHNGTN